MRIPLTLLSTAVALCSFSLTTHAGKPQRCADGQQRTGGKLAACTTANTPPAVIIVSPLDGARFEEGTSIALSGRATDAEDGDLSGAIVWQPKVAPLTAGSYAITASVQDSGGLTASATATITIVAQVPPPNEPPTLSITSPGSGSQVAEGTPLTLAATASDREDGDISARIQWQPAAAGDILLLPAGNHVLSASVTDSGGLSVTQQVAITVIAASSGSGVANLSWQVPTTRENGEPLSPSELAGYEIYVTREETGAGEIFSIGDPLASSFSMQGLAAGTYDFAISAVDVSGLKSRLSNVVSKLVQ